MYLVCALTIAALYGVGGVIMFLTAKIERDGSTPRRWIYRLDEWVLAFRRPLLRRVSAGGLALSFALFAIIRGTEFLASATPVQFLWGVACLLCWAGAFLCWRGASLRKPLLVRVPMTCLSIACALAPQISTNLLPKSAFSWLVLISFLYCLVFLGLASLFWLAAGPQEVSIDLQERTYQATVGWPLFPRLRTGLLDDLGEIEVTTWRGRSSIVFTMSLGRTVGRLTLGMYLSDHGAVSLAEEVSEATGLPFRAKEEHYPQRQLT